MVKEAAPSPVRTLLSLEGSPSTLYTAYSIKLWDERPARYAKNVLKHVCVFLLILTTCNQVANFALQQSLKNFFEKLGWSSKGSNSMKLTYDSLTQFSCIVASYIADEHLGKFKTLLFDASLGSVGLLLLVVGSMPTILTNRSVSKVIFNIGLFAGVALSQICLRALVVSYGGDQFSSLDPPEQKNVFFGFHVSVHGVGAIPAEYGYFFVYLIAFVAIIAFGTILYSTRGRYVNVPPRKSSISLVISIMVARSKTNFHARMIVLGTVLYIAAFLLNIVASFLSDHGEVGHHISHVCGVLILIAAILWVYFGRDSEFLEGAKDTAGGTFDSGLVDGVKKVIRILPFNAFNVFFWVCQNQRGNNQTIIQQTDVRVGDGIDAYQIPGPTEQMFNPIAILLMVPLTRKALYPLYEKYTGKRPSQYGKVFAGFVVVIIAMFWTGTYEIIRRNASPLTYISANGEVKYILNDDGGQVMNNIPWWTAIPQYLLIGIAEVLSAITAYDINYSEVPSAMRGTSIALGFFVNSMGSTLLSVIVLLFGKYIPANLNSGHFEYMYYTIGAVMIVNIAVFAVVMNQMQLGTLPPVDKDAKSEASSDIQTADV